MKKLLLLPLAAIGLLFSQMEPRGRDRSTFPEQHHDTKLPNGKSQQEEILKAEHQKTLEDASELVKLAEQVTGIANFHFREEVINGTMVFDYRLRSGPSPTTNALKIMALEGLPIEEDAL